ICRIDQAMGTETSRLEFQAVSDITVVPTVVDNLDQDGVVDRILIHLLDEHLNRSGDRWRLEVGFVRMSERKAVAFVGPYMHVCIDDSRSSLGKGSCRQPGDKR